MKTILLTGATGFLGSHLLEALLHNKYNVVILKRSNSDLWRISHLLEQVQIYNIDNGSLKKPFEEQSIDVIMHTACHYGRNGDPLSLVVESNLMFGLRLLELATLYNVDSFINTDTLLQKHLNIYTLSKKQFVEWLKQQSGKVQVINLRPEHMYGPKDDKTKFVSWVISQLDDNALEIKLTKGIQTRDFIYIDDVVTAFMLMLEKSEILPQFSEFDIGTGKSIMLRDFIEQLKITYESQFGKVQTVLNFGAIPYREGEVMDVVVNNIELLELGWSEKTDLASGIEKTLKAR